ncbi:MAG: hypothetical protein JXQ75_01415 [Phycisphaerae bacterium]|nr:hypothetical protein [Phycisphaerae bacterium]
MMPRLERLIIEGAKMIRTGLSSLLAGLLLVAVGCQKAEEEPQHAVIAKDALMPPADPSFEASYVADQKQVKLVDRDVSFEPLDSFRSQAAGEDEELTSAKKPDKPKSPKDTKKKGLFGRLVGKLSDTVSTATAGVGTMVGGGGPSRDTASTGVDDDKDDDWDLDDDDDDGDDDWDLDDDDE